MWRYIPWASLSKIYEYTSTAPGRTLDAYNGRYGVTPDYPNGTYAYFQTIDAQEQASVSLYHWDSILWATRLTSWS